MTGSTSTKPTSTCHNHVFYDASFQDAENREFVVNVIHSQNTSWYHKHCLASVHEDMIKITKRRTSRMKTTPSTSVETPCKQALHVDSIILQVWVWEALCKLITFSRYKVWHTAGMTNWTWFPQRKSPQRGQHSPSSSPNRRLYILLHEIP